jgi:hypothetical protein
VPFSYINSNILKYSCPNPFQILSPAVNPADAKAKFFVKAVISTDHHIHQSIPMADPKAACLSLFISYLNLSH